MLSKEIIAQMAAFCEANNYLDLSGNFTATKESEEGRLVDVVVDVTIKPSGNFLIYVVNPETEQLDGMFRDVTSPDICRISIGPNVPDDEKSVVIDAIASRL